MPRFLFPLRSLCDRKVIVFESSITCSRHEDFTEIVVDGVPLEQERAFTTWRLL